MPYETIQYPRIATYDFEPTTELSVHWGRESWVQLNIEQHADLSGARPGGPLVDDPTVIKPAGAPDVPLGSVRVKDGCVAVKVHHAVDAGNTGELAQWTVTAPTPADATKVIDGLTVPESDVADWPLIYLGDGRSTAATVITNPLDRAQVNHLIRTLRRARDAAYGADA